MAGLFSIGKKLGVVASVAAPVIAVAGIANAQVKQESFNYRCNTGNTMNVIFETGGPIAYAYFTYGGSVRVTLKQVPSNFGAQFTDGNYHMEVEGAQVRLKQSNNSGADTCFIIP